MQEENIAGGALGGKGVPYVSDMQSKVNECICWMNVEV